MSDPDPTPAAWIVKAAAEICVQTFLDAAVNYGIDEEMALKYLDDKTIPHELILRNAAIIERHMKESTPCPEK